MRNKSTLNLGLATLLALMMFVLPPVANAASRPKLVSCGIWQHTEKSTSKTAEVTIEGILYSRTTDVTTTVDTSKLFAVRHPCKFHRRPLQSSREEIVETKIISVPKPVSSADTIVVEETLTQRKVRKGRHKSALGLGSYVEKRIPPPGCPPQVTAPASAGGVSSPPSEACAAGPGGTGMG